MKVVVTQKHIDNGARHSCTTCPVALAVGMPSEGPYLNSVGASFVYLEGVTYNLPKIARRFIRDFDAGLKVSPFEFKI